MQEFAPRKRSLSDWLPESLDPPRVSNLLIEGEKVFYRESRHPVMLVRPAAEAVAAVQLGLWLMFDEPGLLAAPLALWAVASAVVLVMFVRRVDTSEVLWRGVMFAVLAAVTSTGLPGFLWLVMGAMVVRLFRKTIAWRWYRRLYVTDRRIMETKGILDRTVASMPLGRVFDARASKTFFGRWLGYGQWTILAAPDDQPLAHLNFLRDVLRFNDIVVDLATDAKSHTTRSSAPNGAPDGGMDLWE